VVSCPREQRDHIVTNLYVAERRAVCFPGASSTSRQSSALRPGSLGGSDESVDVAVQVRERLASGDDVRS